ncbi:tRNA preQ1(34) S-adenosylmethionine ribosyltransferase-isomerase QueA [Nannocystis radixulma]|uniref:S-adenosylmethionine:tRNA ribosyltransferase-isomerase n=1 Tax=Nannocystis radixulma TaxID=2995305 RepID=A0ABT5BM55_9BACT|nr:tRNA preQ1(34) S-adenosylmethionine ribosyltransferase-isomerase QueA [Nannocystis radixulma]MDC0674092.1 tRNA preQ1(34) S-adenosylmethionine ribosyltransferase-isomerase QueA [Nannocystis radixulma]
MGPEAYDYVLPPEQIAQTPAARRGDARMLVQRDAGAPVHAHARELPRFLDARALVVVNDSRVVPARLRVQHNGRELELLVCDPRPGLLPGQTFRAWVRGAKRLRAGDVVRCGEWVARYVEPDVVDPRARVFCVEAGEWMGALTSRGEVPLPPYIRRPAGPTDEDASRYQTTYAAQPGSVAAPTAGLHWEPEVLAQLDVVRVTLHVGPGTFLPLEAEDVREHKVGAERVELDATAASRIAAAKAEGRPVVAVGTTATRALEAVARAGEIAPFSGTTDLVIAPGFEFKVVDAIVTNFHLPRSSLLMLVCCLGGRERVLAAYAEAVAAGYRFYSYGDCMLLTRL